MVERTAILAGGTSAPGAMRPGTRTHIPSPTRRFASSKESQ
ncbi:MAG: hypothetical protein OXI26_02850 [bacterium]|nr:hypothetical protein [bacterium]